MGTSENELSESFGLPSCLDHVGHVAGLLSEFFEKVDVVIIVGTACEEEQVVRLVAPRLEPVRSKRDRPVDQTFKSEEFITGRGHVLTNRSGKQ